MHQSKFLWTWVTILLLSFVGCSSDSASSDPPTTRTAANKLIAAPLTEASDDERILGFEAPGSSDWTSDRGTASPSQVFIEGTTALALELPSGRTEVCSSELSLEWKQTDTIAFQFWMQEPTESLGEVRVVLRPANRRATPIALAPTPVIDKEPGVFHSIVSSLESDGLVVWDDAPIQVCIVIDAEAGRYVLDDLRFTEPPSSDEGGSDAIPGMESKRVARRDSTAEPAPLASGQAAAF